VDENDGTGESRTQRVIWQGMRDGAMRAEASEQMEILACGGKCSSDEKTYVNRNVQANENNARISGVTVFSNATSSSSEASHSTEHECKIETRTAMRTFELL
jgi:hypothetical protein